MPGALQAVEPGLCAGFVASASCCLPSDCSSPHTWGTHEDLRPGQGDLRFIPTDVVNATRWAPGAMPWTVHPHARGERSPAGYAVTPNSGSPPTASTPAVAVHPHARGERCSEGWFRKPRHGSSPRTWGTRLDARDVARLVRFIPTHVGNASRTAQQAQPTPVHPHARGERGNPVRPRLAAARFIPTHVGNARCSSRHDRQVPVHPHARGERALMAPVLE